MGLFREELAGNMVLLADLGYFPGESNSIENALDREYQDCKFFAMNNGKRLHCKSFSRAMLHYPRNDSFPHGGWKGSDSMVILRWQLWRLGLCLAHLLDESHKPVLEAMYSNVKASIGLFELLYPLPLFVPRDLAVEIHKRLKIVVRGYSYLAKLALELGKTLYSMVPKLHGLDHVTRDVRKSLCKGHEYILNPLCFACDTCVILRYIYILVNAFWACPYSGCRFARLCHQRPIRIYCVWAVYTRDVATSFHCRPVRYIISLSSIDSDINVQSLNRMLNV